jgi:hypothetical protein
VYVIPVDGEHPLVTTDGDFPLHGELLVCLGKVCNAWTESLRGHRLALPLEY